MTYEQLHALAVNCVDQLYTRFGNCAPAATHTTDEQYWIRVFDERSGICVNIKVDTDKQTLSVMLTVRVLVHRYARFGVNRS